MLKKLKIINYRFTQSRRISRIYWNKNSDRKKQRYIINYYANKGRLK